MSGGLSLFFVLKAFATAVEVRLSFAIAHKLRYQGAKYQKQALEVKLRFSACGEASLTLNRIDWGRAAGWRVSIAFVLLASCKIVSIDDDRAMRARLTGDLDARVYVDRLWASRAVPELQRRARQASVLVPAIAADINRAGVTFGRKTGEGAAWTFVVAAGARVLSVDRRSRRGTATVSLDGAMPVRTAIIQIGPVVAGGGIRNALPFITFNDFSDQLVFADVARALTSRAARNVAPVARRLQPGDHVTFDGVFDLRRADDPIVITPYRLSPAADDGR